MCLLETQTLCGISLSMLYGFFEYAAFFQIAKAMWLYFFSKHIELLDTVMFILRKKNSHISVLHVYHHASMCIYTWANAKWLAGGSCMEIMLFFVYEFNVSSFVLTVTLETHFQK